MEAIFNGIKWTDDDVVNLDEYDTARDGDRYGMKLWLIHDHGFALAVVFARCESDALDEAVDADKLDAFMVKPEDMADYPDDEGITFLGNAGEPFDIEGIDMVQMPVPKLSLAKLFDE